MTNLIQTDNRKTTDKSGCGVMSSTSRDDARGSSGLAGQQQRKRQRLCWGKKQDDAVLSAGEVVVRWEPAVKAEGEPVLVDRAVANKGRRQTRTSKIRRRKAVNNSKKQAKAKAMSWTYS
jgi:hypothetical protein